MDTNPRRNMSRESVKLVEHRTHVSNYLLRSTRRSSEDMQYLACIKCFLVPLIMCYYLTNRITLAKESVSSDPMSRLTNEAYDELGKTMIRSADGQLHLVISHPQAVPFSPDEHLFTSNPGEHISLASEHHPTTQTANFSLIAPENSNNNKSDTNKFISVLNNQSNIVFSVSQASEGSPQRQLVGELADKNENTLASRYKWSLYDSRGVDSFDSQTSQHYSDSNNNDTTNPITSSTSTLANTERKPMKEEEKQQHLTLASLTAGPQKKANVMMISYTTMKPASYKVTSTTLATPAKVSQKPVASFSSPRATHYFRPSSNEVRHPTSAFFNTIHNSLRPAKAPSGVFTTDFRPSMLLQSWPIADTNIQYSLDTPNQAQLDSNQLFSVLPSDDDDDDDNGNDNELHHSQIHARSPKESSLEEFLRAAASSQNGQQEEIQHQHQHQQQQPTAGGESMVEGVKQLLRSHQEPALAETTPEIASLMELSHGRKPASISMGNKPTNVIDHTAELSNSREVALETATESNNNNNNRQLSGRKQQTKESTGRQSIKQQPTASAKKRKTLTNNAKDADRELLVGPFKSESDAPATITLSGVVYQKSGSSSSILHRQVKQQQQNPVDKPRRIAAAASSSSSSATSLTEDPLDPREGPLELVLDNGEGRELQLSLDSTSSGSFGNQNLGENHSFGGSSSTPYSSGSSGRLTTDAALAELLLRAALKSNNRHQPATEGTAELSMEGGESLLAQLEASQHQRGPKDSSFMTTPDASFSLEELQQQQPQAQHQFQQLTLDSVGQPFGAEDGRLGAQSADYLQSVVEDQLAEHGGKLSASQLKAKPSSLLLAEAFSAAKQNQQHHSGGQFGSATLQQIAKEIQQSFYQPTSGKTSNFGLQVAAADEDQTQFFTGEEGAGEKVGPGQHQMLLSGTTEEELQLAAASEGRKKRPHGPIVIVQKDVKPVKYHLLRAYLALRRFIRPFEATYVFPPDPFGPMTSSLLGRRQQHPVGGAGSFMATAPFSPAFSSIHRQMGTSLEHHSQLLEQLASYRQSMKSSIGAAPMESSGDSLPGAQLRQVAKLSPQRVHQHHHRHQQHRQPPPRHHQRLIQAAPDSVIPARQVQVVSSGAGLKP